MRRAPRGEELEGLPVLHSRGSSVVCQTEHSAPPPVLKGQMTASIHVVKLIIQWPGCSGGVAKRRHGQDVCRGNIASVDILGFSFFFAPVIRWEPLGIAASQF